jgi:putative flippase GtrA
VKNLQNKLKNSQKLKFVAIGGLNTALDFAILFGLNALGLPKILSNGVSTGVTFLISFILNKKITFKSEAKTKRELAREMLLFTIVTLFGLWAIQSVVILATEPLFLSFLKDFQIFEIGLLKEKLALFAAKIIATLFSLTWNFILYKKVVFKK